MDLTELIAALEDVLEEHGDETPVRVAHQPRYPLEACLDRVTVVDGTVYIACRESYDYAPEEAWGREEV